MKRKKLTAAQKQSRALARAKAKARAAEEQDALMRDAEDRGRIAALISSRDFWKRAFDSLELRFENVQEDIRSLRSELRSRKEPKPNAAKHSERGSLIFK